MRIKEWIEGHLGVVLLLAMVAGLFLPGLEVLPKELIPYLMLCIIYFAASKIHFDDLKAVRLRDVSLIFVGRFLALPVLAFFVAQAFFPVYAYAFLLLLLLPTGATLTAVMGIMRGNPALGLGATVVTSFAAPFIIPLAFEHLAGAAMDVDAIGMFKSLAFMIFLPVLLFIATVRFAPRMVPRIEKYSSMAAVLLIAVIAIIIFASQRALILADIGFLFQAVLVGLGVYAFLYLTGWVLFVRQGRRQRVSYALMCGNNNIALGVSLSFLYLPEQDMVIMVVWEMSWLLGLTIFQYFVSKYTREC